jgi:hypothetical protein
VHPCKNHFSSQPPRAHEAASRKKRETGTQDSLDSPCPLNRQAPKETKRVPRASSSGLAQVPVECIDISEVALLLGRGRGGEGGKRRVSDAEIGALPHQIMNTSTPK